MKNKVVFITGSTDGIGKETALELAKMGARVLLHARNEQRGNTVLTEIKKEFPSGIFDLFIADLESLEEVTVMAEKIKSNYQKLDVLINNAGTFSNKRILGKDGFEKTFAVNYLSHFALTKHLLPVIEKAEQGRIINVSSMMHASARLEMDNLQGEKFYSGNNAYSCSKLEQLLFTISMSEKLKGTNVTVNGLHPGYISTKLAHAAMGSAGGASVKGGAATSVYLASAPEVAKVTGKYFVNKKQSNPSPMVFDVDLQTQLWQISESLVK